MAGGGAEVGGPRGPGGPGGPGGRRSELRSSCLQIVWCRRRLVRVPVEVPVGVPVGVLVGVPLRFGGWVGVGRRSELRSEVGGRS